MRKTFVISLGGSIINPGSIDTNFLKDFRKMVMSQIKKGHRFIIITGGGRPAREYLGALKKLDSNISSNQLDWMGIAATRLNAEFIKLIFGKLAHIEIVVDPNKKLPVIRPVLVGGGWIPGRSTDDDAVRLAKTYSAGYIINLFDQDYAYTKDPRKFKDAKKIEAINWTDFRKIVGNKWDPGKNLPFDPTAAKLAQSLKLKVIIANGKNLKNLQNILNGDSFQGTVIG
ncbi:MAG: UMP kinase [Candidatus Doudnabacteria bacterium]|nr:UMP kinase [Candidatus Doudnabacteria bacterium]